MSDALVSPAIGGALWVAAAALTARAARRVESASRGEPAGGADDAARIPLMGVLGAFVLAAQMVNFAIPGTGSSGHLGGGLLLAVLLGPQAAFLVMASVVAVQALLLGDGGLLALGCNAVNLGFLPACVAYPLLWRPIAGRSPGPTRIVAASLVAGVAGLQLGALGVVAETAASGVSSLPAGTFAALMLSIHLVIGVAEGLLTAAVILLVRRARPELLAAATTAGSLRSRPLLGALAVAALLLAGLGSRLASDRPDGLEWSLARAAGTAAARAPQDPGRAAAAGLAGSALLVAAALAVGPGLSALRALRRRAGRS